MKASCAGRLVKAINRSPSTRRGTAAFTSSLPSPCPPLILCPPSSPLILAAERSSRLHAIPPRHRLVVNPVLSIANSGRKRDSAKLSQPGRSQEDLGREPPTGILLQHVVQKAMEVPREFGAGRECGRLTFCDGLNHVNAAVRATPASPSSFRRRRSRGHPRPSSPVSYKKLRAHDT
jgi:hypothetical protein